MKAAKPEIMKRQMDVLHERYDLTNRPAKDVTMSRGKPVQEGIRAKLSQGMTPMHRGAQAEEMAGMVLFLCSDAASYVQTYLLAATFIGRLRGILTNVRKRGGAKP